MLKLKEEKIEDKNKNFLSPLTFKKQEIIIDESFYNTNNIIKGGRKTGKTEKVFIPAFVNCKNAAIYIDYEKEGFIEISKKCKDIQIIDIKNINKEEFRKLLEENKKIYINIDRYNKNHLLNLNNFFNLLYLFSKEGFLKNEKINVFIDNFQYMSKLDKLPDLLMTSYIFKFTIGVHYSKQLESFYGDLIVNNIKENSISYDVEKQFI